MKILKRIKSNFVLFFIILIQLIVISPSKVQAATATVGLGTADSFAVLGGSTVTNTGSSVITGDLGLSPGTSVTGFPPGTSGTIHAADATALQAQNDSVTASNDISSRSCDVDLTGQDLGGLTLTSGVYCFSSSAQLTGTLTLNAEGNSSAVFIFKIGSTLTTASSSTVSLINSAQSCNVFWQVGSSATLGTATNFKGNILASESITLNTSATMNGRALARNGAVTLDTNTVSKAVCATPTSTPTPTSSSSSNSSSGSSTSTPVCIDSAPTNNPDLFQIDRVGSKAILYFSPVSDRISYYYIAYGLSPGDERYGVSFPSGLSTGVVSYTINDLNPNTTYYFKVRGGNGCAPGEWSNNRESNSKNPSLPNTGFDPQKNNILWYALIGTLMGISVLLVLVQRKLRCLSKN